MDLQQQAMEDAGTLKKVGLVVLGLCAVAVALMVVVSFLV